MNPQQGQFGGQPQMVDDKGMMFYQNMPIMMNQVGHPNGGYIMQMPVDGQMQPMQMPAQYGAYQGDGGQGPQMNMQPMQMAPMQGYPHMNAQQVAPGQQQQLIAQQPQLMGQQQTVIGQIPQNMQVGMSVQPMK